MPTYQYACTACGHRFEAVQSFSDASLTDCPECAGRLRKVFSSVGIVFKGSGFYRTDSRAGASRRPRQGEGVGRVVDVERLAADAKGSSSSGLVVEEVRLRMPSLDLVVVLVVVVDQQRTRRGRVRLTPSRARLSTSPSVVHRFAEHRPPVGPSP